MICPHFANEVLASSKDEQPRLAVFSDHQQRPEQFNASMNGLLCGRGIDPVHLEFLPHLGIVVAPGCANARMVLWPRSLLYLLGMPGNRLLGGEMLVVNVVA